MSTTCSDYFSCIQECAQAAAHLHKLVDLFHRILDIKLVVVSHCGHVIELHTGTS
jgi:hypothetical protein